MGRLRSIAADRALWGWLALCLVVKSALVLSLADVFFYGEELEKGTAAKAMLDGLAVPHHQLAYHYYEGGGFVVSHLKALAFLVVGENLLAHKLVALCFVLAVLAAGYGFTRSRCGPRAAHWFALLFVFAPASFQKLSLINLGIHFEAGLFLFGVLGLGARLAFGQRARGRAWFALGLVSGFGVYFSYQVALAAAWVGLVLVVLRPREVFGRGGLLGLAGTLLGAAPLLWMYALVGDALFDIHGESLAGGAGAGNLERLGAFARSVFVDAPFWSRVTAWAWGVASLASLPLVVRRGEAAGARRCAGLYVLGYLLLFALVYVSSGFAQGEVYHFFVLLRLAPLWLFATVLVAAGLSACADQPRPGPRAAGLALGGLLVALGLHGSFRTLRDAQPTTPVRNGRVLLETKGYDYGPYFAKVLGHFEGDAAQKLELLEAFDESDRDWLRCEAVGGLFREGRVDPARAVLRALEVFGRLDPARLEDYTFGLGPQLVIASGWDPDRALALVELEPSARGEALVEAIGRFGAGAHPLRANVDREVARGARLARREAYWRGLGRWIFARYRLDEARAAAFFEAYEQPVGALLLEGYRRERRWRMLPE